MRTWLFYKITERNEKFIVQFRSFRYGEFLVLPDSLNGEFSFPRTADLIHEVSKIVREARWFGDPPRLFNGEIGEAILNGRW